MLYRKQTNFDQFRCIAASCPKSCCEGWQILIDERSMANYDAYNGPFSERLRTGIDHKEHCFRQSERRCSMLAASGLCDLQTALGETFLCDTCRQYPRHTEEFPDLREYSLSLSCPEAARMLLDPSYTFDIIESEDAAEDPEEYEELDFLLSDQLDIARDRLFAIAGEKTLPLQKRMQIIAAVALKLQELYDEGDLFAMEMLPFDGEAYTEGTGAGLSYNYMQNSLQVLLNLENLESSWPRSLLSAQHYWSTRSVDSVDWGQAMYPEKDREFLFEKILKSFLYTYFCGSVYDGQIYARTMLAVASVRWIMMLDYAQPDRTLTETVYLFSREIEHSDPNINALISHFESEL